MKSGDTALERLVAIKQLQLLEDPEARERFKREAKALARMSHPNIPAIYDVRFDESEMFILFAFVEGQTLRNLIETKTVPPLNLAIRWFTQVAAALDHPHSKDLVHRDVKPENIIVSPNHENATLVDFGIALSAADAKRLTKKGYVIGTPAYMSPEQIAGSDLDGRTDLYSLGITLYETLASQMPAPAGYRSLSEANEAIPPGIDDLIKSCLASDRTVRVSSAQEFIKRLRSAIRSDIPLSALLADGRLHEIAGALRQMSAEEFHAKPRGQKLLLLNRLNDLVRTDRYDLRNATAEVIALLTRLGRLEPTPEYEVVVSYAFHWGFEKSYGPNWQGNEEIRAELISAAKVANGGSHDVISREFLKLLRTKDLSGLPHWYAHDVRPLVTALLANPDCGQVADDLAAMYDAINEATH